MDLSKYTLVELRQMAKEKNIPNVTKYKKEELIELLKSEEQSDDTVEEKKDTNAENTPTMSFETAAAKFQINEDA